MANSFKFVKKFDNFDKITTVERQRLGKLAANRARAAAAQIRENAPVSDISEAGYVHMRDTIEARQISAFLWGIFVDKMIQMKDGEYPLWKILEHGTRTRPPKKFIGPVMDIIGPEFLREAGKFEKT